MSDGLEELRARRFAFLKALYDAAEGSTRAMVPMDDIGAQLGFDRRECDRIVDYLRGEDLLAVVAFGPTLEITHWGVQEVEEALGAPNQPTVHFPPIVVTQNYVQVATMSHSQIQQGTVGSAQVQQSLDVEALRQLVFDLREIAPALDLTAEERAEYDSDLETVTAQLASPRPKVLILRESLHSARAILEGAAGAGVAAAASDLSSLIEQVGHVLASLPT